VERKKPIYVWQFLSHYITKTLRMSVFNKELLTYLLFHIIVDYCSWCRSDSTL